jgi:hypothetical protein
MQLYRQWARWALLNLAIVSAAGVLLRCKILFPLPVVDHKNLLHGHSHFAFSGWVSLALFTAIVAVISPVNRKKPLYNRLFWLGQLAGYGMLLTFPFTGYKAPSITFSTVAIVFSYLFTAVAWKDMNRSELPAAVTNWFKAALFFNVLSSLGTFSLAWLMATHTATQFWYMGSVYFYLHFQYNGFFLFAIMGLFFYQVHLMSITVNSRLVKTIFKWLFISCIPAFLLSALWMALPGWMYWSAAIAALMQIAALVFFGSMLYRLRKKSGSALLPVTKGLWILAGIAFFVKFLMQGLSAIPSLSYLAFGFRPIVIAYLHLVLLVFVTCFMLGHFIQQRLFRNLSFTAMAGLVTFAGGVVLNELLLFIQGVAAIQYTSIGVINYWLLAAAVLMFTGLTTFLISQREKMVEHSKESSHRSGAKSITFIQPPTSD